MMPHIGDTQVAWLLLLYTPRAQFALRTLAPGLTREFAVAHDAAVLDTLSALLCAEERSSLPPAGFRMPLACPCTASRRRRTRGRLAWLAVPCLSGP